MQKFYTTYAIVAFWAGLAFAILDVVYGYFFDVWMNLGLAIGGLPDAWLHMSKFGETMLFGFLAIALLFMSSASSCLATMLGSRR